MCHPDFAKCKIYYHLYGRIVVLHDVMTTEVLYTTPQN